MPTVTVFFITCAIEETLKVSQEANLLQLLHIKLVIVMLTQSSIERGH